MAAPVAAELASEGIELIDSTFFLRDQLPQPGTLSKRKPDDRERGDIEYGLGIANEIARLDLGQTIVVRGVPLNSTTFELHGEIIVSELAAPFVVASEARPAGTKVRIDLATGEVAVSSE